MGLFDRFKSKNKIEKTPEKSNLILSMPMFNSDENYALDKLIHDLESYWDLKISDISGDDSVATFNINDETVAVAIMPVPIPQSDLEGIFQYNYLWKDASEELKAMTNHAIVTVLSSETDFVERFKIVTKLNASILRTTTNSMGIYQGSQTLLIPKNVYLDFADLLHQDILPIQLWLYIGIINQETTSSAYTYGLKEFGNSEIEIINSTKIGSELYDFIHLIIDYIIGSDVVLKHGETIGFSAEQKIKITKSKAVYLEGDSLKLDV
ncbi:DUF4261 domain-containing protein [Flavobacterium ardleyense]|uniref:DUF4261 domain-containing protein n=1 Tax=Flavobacterium ardleyense TaxID=2038737 RepID=A0ABW5ZA27_9FLAO